MDGLHEELNVRQKKPYIESPEYRKDLKKTNDEFWCNFLRRNWSFLVFLYYGQMKSVTKCTVCHTQKVNYQAFSNISVPIPNSNTLLLPILVYQVPGELSVIIRNHLTLALNDHFGDSMDAPGLKRGQSIAVMDKADEFVTTQAKRERAILINIMIDQGQTVG